MNKVLLMGKLGFDPDMKTTQGGLCIANLSVTTIEPGKEGKAHFEYHKVVAFGKTAESCGKYLRQGSQVLIEGKLKTDSYEKNGQKVKATKVIADAVKFLDQREEKPKAVYSDIPF